MSRIRYIIGILTGIFIYRNGFKYMLYIEKNRQKDRQLYRCFYDSKRCFNGTDAPG